MAEKLKYELYGNFLFLDVDGRPNRALTQMEFIGLKQKEQEENRGIIFLCALVDYGQLAQQLQQPVVVCEIINNRLYKMKNILSDRDCLDLLEKGEGMIIGDTMAFFSESAWWHTFKDVFLSM